jgi:hypothetical protein
MENRTVIVASALLVFATSALAEPWLKDQDITYVMVGREVTGHYMNGANFTETYHRDGSITYADAKLQTKGKWSVSQGRFCMEYGNAPGGCYLMRKVNDNCFEYWLADTDPKKAQWFARASQTKYPTTCPKK